MTPERITRLRRRSFTDIVLMAALCALVGAEVGSLASVANALAREPSGLTIEPRGDGPVDLTAGAPDHAALQDERLARGDRTTPSDGALTL